MFVSEEDILSIFCDSLFMLQREAVNVFCFEYDKIIEVTVIQMFQYRIRTVSLLITDDGVMIKSVCAKTRSEPWAMPWFNQTTILF